MKGLSTDQVKQLWFASQELLRSPLWFGGVEIPSYLSIFISISGHIVDVGSNYMQLAHYPVSSRSKKVTLSTGVAIKHPSGEAMIDWVETW